MRMKFLKCSISFSIVLLFCSSSICGSSSSSSSSSSSRSSRNDNTNIVIPSTATTTTITTKQQPFLQVAVTDTMFPNSRKNEQSASLLEKSRMKLLTLRAGATAVGVAVAAPTTNDDGNNHDDDDNEDGDDDDDNGNQPLLEKIQKQHEEQTTKQQQRQQQQEHEQQQQQEQEQEEEEEDTCENDIHHHDDDDDNHYNDEHQSLVIKMNVKNVRGGASTNNHPLRQQQPSNHRFQPLQIFPTKKSQSQETEGVVTLDGRSSMTASIFNLVNNVAGAGILALSAGQAAGGGTGWIPAVCIAAILGAISARTFVMIGKACELTHEYDFKGLWSSTIGPRTTYMVDTMIAILCFACAIIYSGILGDVFTPLITQSGWIPEAYNHRSINIIVLTIVFLLPMSLLKNLSALAFTSVLGFSSIIYTTMFICWRAFDGTYQLGTGQFVTGEQALRVLPSFEKTSYWHVDFTSLVLMSNYGLAYVAHYNAPNFYRELKNTNSQKFTKMVSIAFILLVSLYIVTMAAGYKTFGDVCMGNILLNYHPNDVLSTLGRLATGLSILFGFPLVAAGARESLINAATSLGHPEVGNHHNHFFLVSTMLAIVTLIAVAVKDVSLVVGLTGAAMGSFIVYICPTLVYTKAVEMTCGKDSVEYRKARWNLALVPFGCAIASLGVYMTLKGSA